jgi:hypothetical protein
MLRIKQQPERIIMHGSRCVEDQDLLPNSHYYSSNTL